MAHHDVCRQEKYKHELKRMVLEWAFGRGGGPELLKAPVIYYFISP